MLFTSSPRALRHRLLPLLSCAGPRRTLGTAVAQAHTPRDAAFSRLSSEHVAHFRALLGDHAVITNESDLSALNEDWMRRYTGQAKLALRPTSVSAVSQILSYCDAQRLAVVPQGGNTGLVGGSVPLYDEIILSLSSMNTIESFDTDSGVVIAQAGVVLEQLDSHVAEAGFRVPLDLGAKGSCQIGGNVATNAGGSRFIRYGSLRASVLGLEAVLPDGRVLDTLTALKKDNTGYDLKQLMIGSEGTLGVITRIALACPVRSAAVDAVILRVEDFPRVCKLLQHARHRLGEILSAVEFMDEESLALATEHLTHVSNPLSDEEDEGEPGADDTKDKLSRGGGLVLIECAGSNGDHNREKLDAFLEQAMEDDVVSNGVVAENETQSYALWELRESLPEAVLKAAGPNGGTLKYDVSLPLHAFHECVDVARQRTKHLPGVRVAAWGHVGDGNLHLNVAYDNQQEHSAAVQSALEPWVYEFVASKRGSVSAEHGLGVMKAKAIGYSKGSVAVEVMRSIKQTLDPNGICNPYKVLPSTE